MIAAFYNPTFAGERRVVYSQNDAAIRLFVWDSLTQLLDKKTDLVYNRPQ
jgi:hypothetical protein